MLKNNVSFIAWIFISTGLLFNLANAFTWPIDVGQYSAPMTSPFGPRLHPPDENHPNEYYDFHPGIDVRIWPSTTVVAAHDGYVDWIGPNGDYGRMIFIGEAGYSYATGYAHLADTVNLYYPLEVVISEGSQIAISGVSSVSSR